MSATLVRRALLSTSGGRRPLANPRPVGAGLFNRRCVMQPLLSGGCDGELDANARGGNAAPRAHI